MVIILLLKTILIYWVLMDRLQYFIVLSNLSNFDISISKIYYYSRAMPIFIIKPTVNISITATPGLVASGMPRILREKPASTWLKLYVYHYNISTNTISLTPVLENTDSFSRLANLPEMWPLNIIRYNNGWYRGQIFLSNTPINNVNTSIRTLEQVKGILNTITPRRGPKKGSTNS